MEEVWLQYKDTNYIASNFGKIINIVTGNELSGKITKKGYRRVVLTYNKIRYDYAIHRLVAEVFIENLGNKPQVNHIDGDKLNNRVDNLEWCTNKENMEHAVSIRLIRKGEDSAKAKLNKEEVIEIKELLKTYTQQQISKKYNVSQGTINGIKTGRTWSHFTNIEKQEGKELNTKLTKQNVLDIRELLKTHKEKDIAEIYGVHQGTINGIKTGRIWQSVA